MAGYVIYIPQAVGDKLEALAKVGLDDLAQRPNTEFVDIIQNGPDGGSGVLYAWRGGDADTDAQLAVVPAQEWQAAKPDPERELPAGRYWFGHEPGRPVLPDDIMRSTTFFGSPVQLADGQFWKIPAARQLPHRHGLDDEGNFKRTVTEEYRKFADLSTSYAYEIFQAIDALDVLEQVNPDAIQEENRHVDVPLPETWKYCVMALSLNYWVDEAVVDFLNLLDDLSMVRVVAVTLELPQILKVRDQKKTPSPVAIPVG